MRIIMRWHWNPETDNATNTGNEIVWLLLIDGDHAIEWHEFITSGSISVRD